ncbi:MAG: glucosamine inositolphosphorylceramide transferase family protein [Bacteroidales bacterium]
MTDTSAKHTKPLRFGLLCNSLILEQWQADSLTNLIEGGMQAVIVVINDNQEDPQSISQKIIQYPYKRLFFRIWSRFLFNPASKKASDVSELLSNCRQIKCKTQLKGFSNFFDFQCIETIQSEKPDFLLRFGFGIIRGEILKAAPLGVWSFHHDNEEIIRGGPPGFWEVFHKHHTNGVILQQLTDSLDKGLILKKIHFRTIRHSYKEHLDQIYFGSSFMPLWVCRAILNDTLEITNTDSKAPILHAPSNSKMLLFILKMIWRRLTFHLNELFRQEDWVAGITKKEDFIENTNFQIQWLKKPDRNSYTADPFIIDFEGDTLVFFESYSYSIDRGHISMAKASEHFEKYYDVLKSDLHFSFPSVFVYEKQLFMIPECFESNGIQLYQFDYQKYKMIFKQTLLDGIAAVDPILFKYGEYWWLFFTEKNQPSTHLYLWFSENMTGPFQPHFNNPVKSDIFSSRPAGMLFEKEGKLFRPAQDCSEAYGIGIVVSEVTELSTASFQEKEINRLSPDKNWKLHKGVHTFNQSLRYIALDAKGFRFFQAGFRNRLLNKLRLRNR